MSSSDDSSSSSSSSSSSPSAAPLNTILLFITLAVLCFVGTISYTNSISVARIEASMVTRSEIELRVTELKTAEAKLEVEIVRMKVAIDQILNARAIEKDN